MMLDERDTMMPLITKKGLEDYMNSKEIHEDLWLQAMQPLPSHLPQPSLVWLWLWRI
jgi:hypothetical protein